MHLCWSLRKVLSFTICYVLEFSFSFDLSSKDTQDKDVTFSDLTDLKDFRQLMWFISCLKLRIYCYFLEIIQSTEKSFK